MLTILGPPTNLLSRSCNWIYYLLDIVVCIFITEQREKASSQASQTCTSFRLKLTWILSKSFSITTAERVHSAVLFVVRNMLFSTCFCCQRGILMSCASPERHHTRRLQYATTVFSIKRIDLQTTYIQEKQSIFSKQFVWLGQKLTMAAFLPQHPFSATAHGSMNFCGFVGFFSFLFFQKLWMILQSSHDGRLHSSV